MSALTLTVRLPAPLRAAQLWESPVGTAPAAEATTPAVDAAERAAFEAAQERLRETQATLDALVTQLTRLQTELLSGHRREIARLAVEIARKVLMQTVREGDYEIEAIIEEALKSAPVHQDVTVHLHPQDLATCQTLAQETPEHALAGLTWVSDPALGRAECVVETPQGVVQSFIDNHLDKIREALERAE